MSDVLASIGVIIFVYGVVSWHFIKAQAERTKNGPGTDRERERYGN